VLLLLWVLSGEQPLLGESRWPQFRGLNGQGVAEGKPSVEFGPATNLLWQTALPAGHSSPCIWGDRIFLTALDGQKLKTI
jgi:outer membrane protein assembly factor BamB